jgi:hypothetical protein
MLSIQTFEPVLKTGVLIGNKSFLEGNGIFYEVRERNSVFSHVLDSKNNLIVVVSEIIQDTLDSIVELADINSDIFITFVDESDKIDDKWIGIFNLL